MIVRRHRTRWLRWPVLMGTLTAAAGCAARAPGQSTSQPLTQVEGVRVLRLAGTPRLRGVAQGYHLADDIVTLLSEFISGGGVPGGSAVYEAALIPFSRRMHVSDRYKQELEGIMEGIGKRCGGPAPVTALGRPITYDDLLAMNCMADALSLACSSFAVWGALTSDGDTLAGRNLDWRFSEALFDRQLVVVRAPDPARSALGWVSIGWPGLIGCYTGMNSEGVTLSIHDAPAGRGSGGTGPVPRTFAMRDALEAARAASAVDDVTRILRAGSVFVGNNVMVTRPFVAGSVPSVVFEYDGNVTHSGGVTVRMPKPPNYQICTNHFRERAQPVPCARYDALKRVLASASAGRSPVTLPDAWEMLDTVAFTGKAFPAKITFTSVVFEPNKRRMHVAFASPGRSAPSGAHVTLDVARLLQEASLVDARE
ncbi:MAG: C45 family autoproteolytic acyltransferase/hydrolase [Phycisphaerae bacterium]